MSTYSKTTWTDGSGSPINATNLNNLESGVYNVYHAGNGLLKVDTNGNLTVATAGTDYLATVPVATSSTVGGVQPVAKTSAMTQGVGVDASGGLWTAPGGGDSDVFFVTFTPVQGDETSCTSDKNFGEITTAYNNGKKVVGIYKGVFYNAASITNLDASFCACIGLIHYDTVDPYPTNSLSVIYLTTSGWTTGEVSSFNTPVGIATATSLGGVKPTSKTSAMTQNVGVDSNGTLWTTPGGGGVLYCTFTYKEDDPETGYEIYECDKTFEDILTAYQSGIYVVGKWDSDLDYQLLCNYGYDSFTFYGFIGGSTSFSAISLSINSNDEVTVLVAPGAYIQQNLVGNMGYTYQFRCRDEDGDIVIFNSEEPNAEMYKSLTLGYKTELVDTDTACVLTMEYGSQITSSYAAFNGIYYDTTNTAFVLERIVVENDVVTKTTKTIT